MLFNSVEFIFLFLPVALGAFWALLRVGNRAPRVLGLVAFAVGYASIAWLLGYVAKHTMYVFVGYRIALGLLVFVLLGANVISAT